jgi:thiol-disulfide isomerase/thioredoxin
MWPFREDRDSIDWARRLEAGRQDDPTLELASQLASYEPEVPSPGHFKSELRARLLAQSDRRESSGSQYFNGNTGRLAVAGGLALFVLVAWLAISWIGDGLAGRDTPAIAVEAPAVENNPIIVATPTVLEVAAGGGPLAADFSLVDASNGQAVTLSQFEGQPIVLNFWATWCVPCREEMPHIEKAYREGSKQNLVVLAVNFDESRQDVVAYGQELGLSFPLLLDPGGDMQQHEYNVYQYPTTLFIAPDGKIRVTHMGPLTEQLLAENLAKIQT